MSLFNLTAAQLRQAADLKEKIEALQSELSQLQGAEATVTESAGDSKKKISAAGIARIRAAQKARWAKVKAATAAVEAAATEAPAKKKTRKMSAAGRARIAAAARARWAKVRSAKAAKAAK
jgi:hypothetical protein